MRRALLAIATIAFFSAQATPPPTAEEAKCTPWKPICVIYPSITILE